MQQDRGFRPEMPGPVPQDTNVYIPYLALLRPT